MYRKDGLAVCLKMLWVAVRRVIWGYCRSHIKTYIASHIFRATGITAYLNNKAMLEHAQYIANHESPRMTEFYDRRNDEISLDEVEKISI